MSFTDLRLIGKSKYAQMKHNSNIKKGRSLSLTNISSLKRNSYDHVESKVKQYIENMKENDQMMSKHRVNLKNESKLEKRTLSIDTDVIKDFTSLLEDSNITEVNDKVKDLTLDAMNLENKVEYISKHPEAIFCLLNLLFEERKLRYEQDLTMKSLQLNYDNLLAKYATAKNSIDSFRLSQEVLTDIRSNSSLASANVPQDDLKKAFSTPDLSIIDVFNSPNQLIKRSYVPVIDSNFRIDLCMEDMSEDKNFCSNNNLKTIWIQIFKNMKEKLKKCILLEKNFALHGEDKKSAWNSIHNDFKCLHNISSYQDDIKNDYGIELEDVKFAISKYSMQYLGNSLLEDLDQESISNVTKGKYQTMNSQTVINQLRPKSVQIIDKLVTVVSNRDNDSGCLTSDCSPHPSLNCSKEMKPYYTTSNKINNECTNSESIFYTHCKFSGNLDNSEGEIHDESNTSVEQMNTKSIHYPFSSVDSDHCGNQNYRNSHQILNSSVQTYCDYLASSCSTEMQQKYSSIVANCSTSEPITPSSKCSNVLSNIENNSKILRKQCNERKSVGHKSSKSKAIDKLPKTDYQSIGKTKQLPHRSLKKHKSTQNINCDTDNFIKNDDTYDMFFTSTPVKQSSTENLRSHFSKNHRSHTKEGKSIYHRSGSLFDFGKEIKKAMQISEALKNQSKNLLTMYNKGNIFVKQK